MKKLLTLLLLIPLIFLVGCVAQQPEPEPSEPEDLAVEETVTDESDVEVAEEPVEEYYPWEWDYDENKLYNPKHGPGLFDSFIINDELYALVGRHLIKITDEREEIIIFEDVDFGIAARPLGADYVILSSGICEGEQNRACLDSTYSLSTFDGEKVSHILDVNYLDSVRSDVHPDDPRYSKSNQSPNLNTDQTRFYWVEDEVVYVYDFITQTSSELYSNEEGLLVKGQVGYGGLYSDIEWLDNKTLRIGLFDSSTNEKVEDVTVEL
ncbi:hypothetical protein KJ742_04050 [Patescibacteria group bacterium]|nr:hypothetical protein [Patescibacteria group bacterium]MBU1683094.1 hypothetical protein [Patescibacteria group bacterium]